MAVFDVEQWLRSLEVKSITPEDIEFGRKEITNGFLRQDEFSRRMDRMNSEYEAKEAANDQYAEQLRQWEQSAKPWLEFQQAYGYTPQDVLNQLSAEQPSGDSQMDEATKQRIAQLEELVQRTQQGVFTIATFLPEAHAKYREEFGKSFPTMEFDKFLQTTGMKDPNAAYEAFTAEDRRKKELEAHAAELEKVKRETEEAIRTRYGITDDGGSTRTGSNIFYSQLTGQSSDTPASLSRDERIAKVGAAFNSKFNK